MQSVIAFEGSREDEKITEKLNEDTLRYNTIFKIAQSAIQKSLIETAKENPAFLFQIDKGIFLRCFNFSLTQEQALKKKYDALLERVQKNPFLLSLQKEKKDLETEFHKMILVLEKFIDRARVVGLNLKEVAIPRHIYQTIHKNLLEKIKQIYIELILAKFESDKDPTDPVKRTDFFSLKNLYADALKQGIDFFKKTPKWSALLKTGLKKDIKLTYNKLLYKATFSHLLETGKLRSEELSGIQKKILKNPTDPDLLLQKKH